MTKKYPCDIVSRKWRKRLPFNGFWHLEGDGINMGKIKSNVFFDMVEKWIVKDYRTQNISAEIMVDMLISEFIEEIVAYHIGQTEKGRTGIKKLKLIAKEFPIPRIGQDPMKKIEDEKQQHCFLDYLLYDMNSTFYLVELKTVKNSFDGKQLLNMLWTCYLKTLWIPCPKN